MLATHTCKKSLSSSSLLTTTLSRSLTSRTYALSLHKNSSTSSKRTKTSKPSSPINSTSTHNTTSSTSSTTRKTQPTLSNSNLKSLEMSKTLHSLSSQEEALQEHQSIDEYPLTFSERHAISILYHYHQSLIENPSYTLDKFISNYLRANKIGKNNKEVIICACYEIEKLYLLLDYMSKKFNFDEMKEKLEISLDQYINRMNMMKMKELGPSAHLLPKSVTFVEENRKSVLHWRLVFALYKEYFHEQDFEQVVFHSNHADSVFRKIPINVLLSCPAQLFDILCEEYGEEKAIEICLINNSEAPVFGRVNDVKVIIEHKSTTTQQLGSAMTNDESRSDSGFSGSKHENITPKEEVTDILNATSEPNKDLLAPLKKKTRKFLKKLSEKYSEVVGKITPSKLSTFGFRFEKKTDFRQWPEFKEGLFEIQDDSSQYIVDELIRNGALKQITSLKPLVLDYCCGTGGKTFALAGALKGKGQIYMHDIRLEKLSSELKRRAHRLGIENIQPLEHDHSHWEKLKDKMNLVILDVPCTGTGTLRRNVELKYKINYNWIKELTKKQREIIENAIPYVRKGNYLLYSTCSILSKENEDQMDYILKKHKNFELVKEIKTLPLLNGGDGMYGALLRRIH
ncbi:hypothetical protein C9374_005746 [Naegleria lovaniensis]|uniref:SAM-dependent MTase RsmB/NOP-type domain-containing protein n=1 Tax=Naegleria lovaniensis TaxID=51637 RepID=A0AA88GMZ5_NAELO|nr:uncharacterized protein C9374_005746 [Naegleria lovaniensis]KAG2381954.1 hypothetical protein C9374_005746 [Naegleria lovaniensis]